MDRNVEAGHTTFVRCRIVFATVLMRCRFWSTSACIMICKWGDVLRIGHSKRNGLR